MSGVLLLGRRRHDRCDEGENGAAYSFVILGVGFAGRAALDGLVSRRPASKILVVDPDKQAVLDATSAASNVYGSNCRASWLDAGKKCVGLSDGTTATWSERCILAVGAPEPHVPSDFVDESAWEFVEILGGRGRSCDDAVFLRAKKMAKDGGRIAVLGGAWPAVQFAARCASFGGEVTLVVPEHSPLFARAPRWLGSVLTRRLERRGVTVRRFSQVSFIARGPRVYTARTFDAMATQSFETDLVVVAGGEYHMQHGRVPKDEPVELGLDEKCAECAPRGASRLPIKRIVSLDMASPVSVNEELCASSTVLAAGDAAATPSRIATSPVCACVPLAPGSRLRSAATLTSHAGVSHAVATGDAAGAHAASNDGNEAASLLDSYVQVYVAEERTLNFVAVFVGRCDSEAETHTYSYPGRSDSSVTLFVNRPRPGAPAVVVGALLWGSEATQPLVRERAVSFVGSWRDEKLNEDERDDELRRKAVLILGKAPSRYRNALSRSERLGPGFAPGAAAADVSLFSRGRNVSSFAQKQAAAYKAGILATREDE